MLPLATGSRVPHTPLLRVGLLSYPLSLQSPDKNLDRFYFLCCIPKVNRPRHFADDPRKQTCTSKSFARIRLRTHLRNGASSTHLESTTCALFAVQQGGGGYHGLLQNMVHPTFQCPLPTFCFQSLTTVKFYNSFALIAIRNGRGVGG